MQTILIKKTEGQNTYEVLTKDLKPNNAPTFLESLRHGMIVLIKRSLSPSLISIIHKHNYLDCGRKQDKIELFRALKHDKQPPDDQARFLLTDFSSLRAMKNSVFSLARRYTHSHPPCIIFIPDNLIDDFLASLGRNKKDSISPEDPLSLFIMDIPDEEAAKKISRVYLGNSSEIALACKMIYRAAMSSSPVLILGESGTGKDIIAQLIFELSDHHKASFCPLNCSSLSNELLESELFGHIKGSFTGAYQDKKGMFEAAHKGTLFLDEIGDLSLVNQAKLLRAVETNEIRPLGSNKVIHVDVRIISATNRNLHSMMRKKLFREDLLYRLNVITIIAPPLREHPEDIPELARAFWKKLNKKQKLSDGFLNYLKSRSWPGNVRELKTLLNTISDLFDDISPEPEHVEAITTYHKKTLMKSDMHEEDDFDKMLRAQSKVHIIEVQRRLREIKIKMRPIINKKVAGKHGPRMKDLKDFLQDQISQLENQCRDPILFQNRMLFEKIKRFRYLIEKILKNWPSETEALEKLWKSELDPLYEQIDQEIFHVIWGRVDM